MTNPSYTPQLFAARLPSRVACCDSPSDGVTYRHREEALKHAHIAPNSRHLCWCLLFDVDRPAALFAAVDAGLPPPTWIAENPKNGHAHIAYLLSYPVPRSDAARIKPLRLLARIEHGIRAALAADGGYAGFLTKTPFHPRWWTHEGPAHGYDFDYLRDFLPDNLPLPRRKREVAGLGRNVRLFDDLRRWAYRARLNYTDRRAWGERVQARAEALNSFTAPLPYSEVKATARSVAKWCWRHITPEKFSEIQRRRAARPRKATQETLAAILRQQCLDI